MRWRSDLTDEQRAALQRVCRTLGYGDLVNALRAAFAASEPRTREGWIGGGFDNGEGWVIDSLKGPSRDTRVLVIELPADADAEAVERVRRAAIEAMP